MKHFYANGGQAVTATPLTVPMIENVSAPGPSPAPFKADWIEAINDGTDTVLVSPYAPFSNPDAKGVMLNQGEGYRFEYDIGDIAPASVDLDKVGWDNLYLLSAGASSVRITAGSR
jgi:hypothetical protein